MQPGDYHGIPASAMPTFFAGGATRNGCAQAAVASLVAYWGGRHLPYPAGADLVAEIYRRFPPNTPRALLGTLPARVEAACRAHGLTVSTWSGWRAAPLHRLRRALRAGEPVIVLLDLRPLAGGWEWHYAVAHGYDDEAVALANMTPTRFSQAARQQIPWPEFTRAWRPWLPVRRLRYLGIHARPCE